MKYGPVVKYWLTAATLAVVTFLVPLAALAAAANTEDEETAKLEGRMEGYANGVRLPEAGNALTWITIFFLMGLTLAALLKNSKRTHLD